MLLNYFRIALSNEIQNGSHFETEEIAFNVWLLTTQLTLIVSARHQCVKSHINVITYL